MKKFNTVCTHSVYTQRRKYQHSVYTQRRRQIVWFAYFLISCDILSLLVGWDCKITKLLIYIQIYSF